MAREINSVQAERVGRSHIAPIPLVKLTLLENHLTGEVDKIYYLSTMAVDYDYGNTGTVQRFLPVVAPSGDFFSGFVHIPQPDDLTAFEQSFDLRCSNVENFNGEYRFSDVIAQTHETLNAFVEVARIYIDVIDTLPVDLSGYTGDEHLVLFRGRVRQFSTTDSVTTFSCETVTPSMVEEWFFATDATKTDSLDLGKRLPRVYGNAFHMPLLNYDVGGVTTLAQDIDNSETGVVKIEDDTSLVGGSFYCRIDDESSIYCTTASAKTMTISTRGSGAAAHSAGAVITELKTLAVYVISDVPSTAVNELYVINPLNDALMRLDSGDPYWPTVDLADASSVSGKTVTSIRFTLAEFTALLSHFGISSASGSPAGYGLRFFADVEGVPVPEPDKVWDTREDFEAGSWSADNCTAAISSDEANTGSNSLKLTWDADAEASAALFPTNSLPGWFGTDAAVALQTGEGHRTGHTSVLEASASSAVANALAWWFKEYYDVLHDFESGSWSAFNCAAAINSVQERSGTNALEITVDLDAEATDPSWSTTALTKWTEHNANVSLTVEAGEGGRGSADVICAEKLTAASGFPAWFYYDDPGSAIDLTDAPYNGGRGLFLVDVKFQHGDGTPPDEPFSIIIGEDSSSDSQWINFEDGMAAFAEDTWYTLVLNWDELIGPETGSPDWSNVNHFQVRYGNEAESENTKMFIDHFRYVKEDAIVQNNAMGGADFLAGADLYRVYSYHDADTPVPQWYAGTGADEFPDVREIVTWISQNTWGTTVIGSDYRRCTFDVDETNDQYNVRDHDALYDDGSPDESDVESMRISVRTVPGIYPRDPVIKHYLDDYSGNTNDSPPDGDMSADLYGANYPLLMFDFKMKEASTAGTIQFRFGADEDNYYHTDTDYDVDDFTEDTWATVIVGIEGAATFGSPTANDINYFGVEFNQANRSASAQVYFDNIKLVPQDCIAQNNDLGSVDLDSRLDQYKIATYSSADALEPLVRVWLSKNTWSSTTIGSDYLRMLFEPVSTPDAWLTKQSTSRVNSGDATMTDIDSLRVTVRNAKGLYSRDPTNIHYIDTLQVNDPVFIYYGSPGDAMIHPSDIMQHFVTAMGGEAIASGDSAALVTALGASAEWGFDTRVLGFTWVEIVQRMAFEARTNIFPVETAAGRTWRMAAADTTYGWGTASTEIFQTHNMSQEGLKLEDMATHFSFRYAFDHALGSNSEEGFTLALVANPTTSNVPISTADITAAAQSTGNKQSGPVAFRCIQDPATAQDAAGYYVQERIDEDRRVYKLSGVAWFDALPLNIGDTVLIQPPWAGNQFNCRIISMSMKFADETWDIIAVSVLGIGIHT